jgi:DNA-binding MarR family transcriptional regulator
MRQDTSDQGTSGDAVDAIVDQWHRERPELDTSAKEITGRIVRISGLIQQAHAVAFAPLGINDADFGILVALRRVGAPYELTPTELARQRMMTSGGMTSAIDRVERKGLVTRAPNPADRRGSLVRLTEEGLTVVDAAMVRQVESERALVSSLPEEDRDRLVVILRAFLLALDPDQS